jgi:hypothetical protein
VAAVVAGELAHRKAVLPVLAVQEVVVTEAQLVVVQPVRLIQAAAVEVATQVVAHLVALAALALSLSKYLTT